MNARPSDVANGLLWALLAAAFIGVVLAGVAWTGACRAFAGQRDTAGACPCPRGPSGHSCPPGRHGRRAAR